ncbi:5027_t:CDS:2, partial [Scutellospora calospora]
MKVIKKKICTTWDPNLSKIYPWLEKSEDNNSSLRKQTFERHLTTVDHQKVTIFQNHQQTTIIQGNQAMNQYPALCQLGYLQFINHEELYFKNDPIYEIIQELVLAKNWSILIDESTSFTSKYLAIVTKYLTQNSPVLRYLGIIELDNCNAESITNNLEIFITAKSLNIKNSTHFGKSIKGALLEKAANNQQATSLLADINQEFEIATMFLAQFISSNEVLPTYGSNLLEYITNNNLKLYNALGIFDPEQLPKLDSDLANYGNEMIKILDDFYRTSKTIN